MIYHQCFSLSKSSINVSSDFANSKDHIGKGMLMMRTDGAKKGAGAETER